MSRTVLFVDGTKKTLGFMQPGEYEFSTGDREVMEVLSGELEYRVGGGTDWKTVTGGEAFEVPANSRFTMKVRALSDYCCSFFQG